MVIQKRSWSPGEENYLLKWDAQRCWLVILRFSDFKVEEWKVAEWLATTESRYYPLSRYFETPEGARRKLVSLAFSRKVQARIA